MLQNEVAGEPLGDDVNAYPLDEEVARAALVEVVFEVVEERGRVIRVEEGRGLEVDGGT